MNEHKANEDRRNVLKSISLILGHTLTFGASSAFLSGCKSSEKIDWTPTTLSQEQLLLIKAFTERIIPKTDTPGANDVLVHRYIDEVISNFYTIEERAKFLQGIEKIDGLTREKYKKQFAEVDDKVKDDILNILAKEWKTSEEENHIFKEIRDLTVTGYATSEIGAKQFFVYDQIPGPFIGCIPYEEVGGSYSL